MNAIIDLVGFVHDEPCVQETSDGTPTALVQLDVYQRADRAPVEIPLRFVGDKGVQIAKSKMTVAALVAVTCSVGNMRPGRIGDFRLPTVVFDVDALEVLDKPDLATVPSVEDFIRMYSAEAVAYRASHGKAPSRSGRGKGKEE